MYTREQVQAEIIRCASLARAPETRCPDLYKARAARLAKAESIYFLQRATCEEIDAAARLLQRDMRDAPAAPHSPEAWQDARKFALFA